MIKAPKTDTEHRISFAQSWNLAVALIAPVVPRLTEPTNEKEVKERNKALRDTIENWQKYFYQKLVLDFVESEGKDALNKLNTVRSDKVQKHTLDVIYDLPEQE